jgi:hypothetical protein
MENTKTNYEYLHKDGNWYLIEIRKCSQTTRTRGTVNWGAPYQIVYIKDGKEHAIRYRRASIETALRELRNTVEHGNGVGNGKRYRYRATE